MIWTFFVKSRNLNKENKNSKKVFFLNQEIQRNSKKFKKDWKSLQSLPALTSLYQVEDKTEYLKFVWYAAAVLRPVKSYKSNNLPGN
jgi:hypothetical protein